MYDDPQLKRRAYVVLSGACLAIFFTALEVREPVFSLGSVGFTTTELAAGVFFLTAAIWAMTDRADFFSRRALDVAVVLFLLSNFISAAFSTDRPSALKFSLRMTYAALVYVGMSRLPARTRSHMIAAGAVTVTMLVVALVGLMQNFIPGVDWPRLLSPWQEGITTFGYYYNIRVASTLPFPTVLSMYLELALPVGIALGLWLSGRRGISAGRKRLWEIATIAGMTAVMAVQIYTYTRSTLMATTASMLGAAGLALIYGYGRRVAGFFAAAVLVLVLVLGASIALSGTAAARYGLAAEESMRYEAEYELLAFPQSLTAGQAYSTDVRVINTSDVLWRKEGSDNFVVTYRWLQYPGQEPRDEVPYIASELPNDVSPGEGAVVVARFNTPAEPGRYVLVLELAKGGVGWLSASGVTPLVVPVEFTAAGGHPFTIHEPPESFKWVDIKQHLLSRAVLWRAAVDIFREHPVLGIGPGQFRNEYPKYVAGIQPDDRIETNNIFLEALANTGLVGLAATVFLLGWSVWQQFLLVRNRAGGNGARLLALGLMAAMAAYLLHGMLDYFLNHNGVTFLFFTLLGLTAWLAAREKERVSE